MILKRWLFIQYLVLSSFYSANIVAVIPDASPEIGIEGGLSLATISTPSTLSSSSITGFAVGVNIDIPLTESVYLQPEGIFSQRGAEIAEANGITVVAKYNSIEVPTLLKVKFGTMIRPYVFAGPNFIFNVSNSLETKTPGATSMVTFEPNTVDVAADMGGGVEVDPIFVSLRYSVGVTELNETSASWYSRGFRVLAGLRLPL